MAITRVQLVGNVSTGASFAGIVTASSFSGNITGGISSVARLQVTGVSTFTNGPVLIGSATSTGTASQPLQVTGGAYVSGNLGVGNTNPTSKLVVQGDGRFVSSGQGDVTITHSNLVSTVKGAATVQLALGANNNEVIRINNSGNVGVGTTNPSSTLSVGGTITELYNGTYWNLVSQADIGIGASQVPLNQYLGQLAFLDAYSPSGLRRDGGGADDVVVSVDGSIGIGTTSPTSTLHVVGNSNFIGVVTATSLIPAETRFISIAEKLTRVNGNTVSLAYNASGANIGFATNPSGNITLAITGIPTTSDFDNHVLTFTVFVNQTGTARSCTAVTLNGVSRTIKWAGGSLANATSGVTTTLGYDIYGFTGINTIGSASTTSNYDVLGVVNGGYR